MRIGHWWILAPAYAVVSPAAAYATVYLTVEQAQQALLPGETLSPVPATLSDEQARQITKQSGVNVLRNELQIWRSGSGAWFIVDEVVGKHEFITWAIALEANGSVRQLEVMDYRETYGDQVRNEAWRRQFVGKTSADPLKLTKDIQNISGATLSCRHIADGVKRVLATWDVLLRTL